MRSHMLSCNKQTSIPCIGYGPVSYSNSLSFCIAESGVEPNVWAYNALIKAHCQAKQLKSALGVRSTIWSNMEFLPL